MPGTVILFLFADIYPGRLYLHNISRHVLGTLVITVFILFECLALLGWFRANERRQNQTLDHPQDPFGLVVKPKLSLMSNRIITPATYGQLSSNEFNGIQFSVHFVTVNGACMLLHSGHY